ncbi:hypothetical protein SDC9_133237 [bioreactor metagenome]|uniref:Uncharacterized protein n=1 Tax=bioreactor metagenome TaxID=1076179 RepID=A0A645D9Y9_9ZZZZ
MVILFMSNKNNGFNDFQNLTLYLIILTILLTYNVTYIFSMSNSNLTIATFSNKLYYNNSKLSFLSLYNKKESKSSFTDFSLDDDRYYSYYLNTSQKKQTNLYKAKSEAQNKSRTAHLPNEFKYNSIDENSLREYLSLKGSLLGEEPYFSSIISTSKDFNLNPLLLFAIAGQEQSFVPKESKNAEKIANNPYNVFNSWQKYNTDISDASRIVSRTVINLSKDKPTNIDLFVWINRKYSEDKDWHYGVRSIYEQLKTYSTFF